MKTLDEALQDLPLFTNDDALKILEVAGERLGDMKVVTARDIVRELKGTIDDHYLGLMVLVADTKTQ